MQPEDGTARARSQLADAARDSAIGRMTEEGLSWPAVLTAIGGWRGIAESIAPTLAFLILNAVTADLLVSVAVAAGIAAAALVLRVVQRQPTGGALAGMFGIVVSGMIALVTGDGADFFVLGLWTNAIYGGLLALTMLVGIPLIGVIIAFATGHSGQWRRDRVFWWWMQGLTGLWVLLFVGRLAVQLPLYQAGEVDALGAARIAMGVPLFAAVLVITAIVARWRLARAGFASEGDLADDVQGSDTDIR